MREATTTRSPNTASRRVVEIPRFYGVFLLFSPSFSSKAIDNSIHKGTIVEFKTFEVFSFSRHMPNSPEKNIVLFVSRHPTYKKRIERLREIHGKTFRYGLLYQSKPETDDQKEALGVFDVTVRCNFDSEDSLTKVLKPYRDELVAVTSLADTTIPLLQKVIPHVPYLRTPTVKSLSWATNKLMMRQRFALYDRSITPKYKVVHNAQKNTIKDLEEKVGFPMVIKPTGLATSLLVTIAYHHEELEASLKRIFRKINKIYRESNGRGDPTVLVEQLMEGEMYSVDVYVGSRGGLTFTPFCHIKTGRAVGFDDFFAYQTVTPTTLSAKSIIEAKEVGAKAIYALGLRSITAHVELLKTENGWKIIEVGPRAGGFRDIMYRLAYNIEHYSNDFLIRVPKPLSVQKKPINHAAVLKLFAPKEGILTQISGVKKAQKLASFYRIDENKKVGDKATFAKHGGKSVFNIYLYNSDRSKLLADIRRLEQMVSIKTR